MIKFIYKVIKFIFKSFASIFIFVFPIWFYITYMQDTVINGLIFTLFSFVGMWIILNYTLPDEIVELIVRAISAVLAVDICESIISAMPIHYNYPILLTL